MPRIVVVEGTHVFMDEDVLPVHLNNEQSAVQLLERLAWALEDANRRRQRHRSSSPVRRSPRFYQDVTPG